MNREKTASTGEIAQHRMKPFVRRPTEVSVVAGISTILALLCTVFGVAGVSWAAALGGLLWILSAVLGFAAFIATLAHELELRLIEVQRAIEKRPPG
jgi:hypothetical protein